MRTFLFLLIVCGGIIVAPLIWVGITHPSMLIPPPPPPPNPAREKCLNDNFDALIALGVKPWNGYEAAGRLCDDKGIYAPR